MLWSLFIILLVVWFIGWIVLPIGGGLIHILLIIALIVLIVQLLGSTPLV